MDSVRIIKIDCATDEKIEARMGELTMEMAQCRREMQIGEEARAKYLRLQEALRVLATAYAAKGGKLE